MDQRRIAELLEPFLGAQDLTPNTQRLIPSISTYIDLLLRWNARINLTAIRDEEEIVTRHFGESLFAARYLFPDPLGTDTEVRVATDAFVRPAAQRRQTPSLHSGRGRAPLQGREERDKEAGGLTPSHAIAAERRQNAAHGVSRGGIGQGDQAPEGRKKLFLADVGSGPGFPGLPIKLWAPDVSLTLIESNHKKATFLREVTRALTLTDVNIQTARAESLPPATFDVVTLRAVERFAEILPTAAGLVVPAGRLVLLIGTAQISKAKSTLTTLAWHDPQPIPLSNTRVLLVGNTMP